MPNWCETRYVLHSSDNQELNDLYERMKRLQEMKEPLKPNGFGTAWLGNLVEDLGVEYGKVSCRGSWDGLSLEGEFLRFWTESRTAPSEIIILKYPLIYPKLCL